MIIYYEPHRIFLKRILESGVDFILVGGHVVNYYGYNRQTGDLDIWLNPTEKNKMLLFSFLRSEGFEEPGLKKIESLNFKELNFFHYGEPPLRIDFITRIKNVIFSKAKARIEILEEGGMKIPILHFDDLMLSKITNERLKDKLDVDRLQKITELKKKKK
jgi:predicted nucleotidyltransferase